jgi:hypothetical protein
LIGSEDLAAATWSTLVLHAARAKEPFRVVTELTFRRVVQGFPE